MPAAMVVVDDSIGEWLGPTLVSPMRKPVSLIRWRWARHAATLIPGSTDFRLLERQKNRVGPPIWLPEVPLHGHFDFIGGQLTALYRIPDAADTLWFQIGGRQVALTDATSSTYTPVFSDPEPRLESADLDRRFRIYGGDTLLVDHAYRLDDREKRLYFSKDPFPSWPDDEENYDLCYFVHRVLRTGIWSRILTRILYF